jgi:hypothetical protein
VEQYFNYMGCLAVEGTYDRMYALLDGALRLRALAHFARATESAHAARKTHSRPPRLTPACA